jgi:hypothetical protein
MKSIHCAVRRTGVLGVILVLALTACAANRGQPLMAPFDAFVGSEARSISFAQLVDWRFLEREWVMLRVNRNRFYAVELMQPCIADVREANAIRLVQAAPGRLTTADRIAIRGQQCRIARIAEFDHAGWLEASNRGSSRTPSGGVSRTATSAD